MLQLERKASGRAQIVAIVGLIQKATFSSSE